jgi:hypothetical protein
VLRVFPNARIQNVRHILSFDVHQGEDMKFDFINVSAIGKKTDPKEHDNIHTKRRSKVHHGNFRSTPA